MEEVGVSAGSTALTPRRPTDQKAVTSTLPLYINTLVSSPSPPPTLTVRVSSVLRPFSPPAPLYPYRINTSASFGLTALGENKGGGGATGWGVIQREGGGRS